MSQHTCYLTLGSNVSAAYVRVARERLTRLFPGISFGTEQQTLPVGLRNPAPFTNQTARFETILTPEEILPLLKHLETAAGRTPAEKAREIIRLDIDLVCYDQQILRPENWALFFAPQP